MYKYTYTYIYNMYTNTHRCYVAYTPKTVVMSPCNICFRGLIKCIWILISNQF